MRQLLCVFAMIASVSAACAASTEVIVPGGGSAVVPGTDLKISLTAVNDNRCPSYADCYWEGLIRVELGVARADGAIETVVLCNLCDEATRGAQVAGYGITLIRLEPGREVLDPLSRNVVLEDYRVVLEVLAG